MNLRMKHLYSARLPSTSCTPEMRDNIESIARKEKTTLNEIQRAALSLFLSQYATNCSNSATNDAQKKG